MMHRSAENHNHESWLPKKGPDNEGQYASPEDKSGMEDMPASRKSLCIAYLLWLTLGVFGVHHFYLNRDRHAFVWWLTFGGVFGCGWMREYFRLPDYVQEANRDEQYIQQYDKRVSKGQSPFNPTRFAGQLIVGALFGFVTTMALPETVFYSGGIPWIPMLLVPYAVGFGVHLVGNIGMECGPLRVALVGAYASSPAFAFDPSAVSYCAAASALLFEMKGRQVRRHRPPRRSLLRRVVTLAAGAVLYMSLWTSVVLHNAKVTTPEGDVIALKDAVAQFFSSELWRNVRARLYDLLTRTHEHGWERVFDDIRDDFYSSMDPHGEKMASRTLNLTDDELLNEGKVNKRCRLLMKQYHPDRHSEGDKGEAGVKFMEVQEACEKLSVIKKRRARRSRTSEL